jgi:cytosine/creatinine deaminase
MAPPLTIANAMIPAALLGRPGSGVLDFVDVVIEDGVIAAIGAPGKTGQDDGDRVDADRGLLLPCFVDMHTHLDKGHIWPRRQNPNGTWGGALDAVLEDRELNWAAADVERRMDFALRCAYAHGTAAIRTHLDSAPPQHAITWDVFSRVREKWRGRIELQAVSIVGPDTCLNPVELDAVAQVVHQSEGILGGSVAADAEARKAVFAVIEKAGELGLEVDLHIDESHDPSSMALRHLADAVMETGFKGAVTAGHCCSLSVQAPDVARTTIERVAEAGINVVSLPMCNLYLMDRDEAGTATPIRRGPTLIKELRAAGVRVAIASDNTRDPFYAYGDLDMVEVFREGARIVHFDHPQTAAWTWVRAVTADPAAICGFAHSGEIRIGGQADFVLFNARSWTELHARPQSHRRVFRGGREIANIPPDYRELDDLMEAS